MPVSPFIFAVALVSRVADEPFAQLPRPDVGCERWAGVLARVDSGATTLSLTLLSVTNARGDERFYGKGEPRTVALESGTPLRLLGYATASIRYVDLRPGDQLAVTWCVGEGGAGGYVREIVLAPRAPKPADPKLALFPTGRAPDAVLDSDGVSSEIIQLPIVFPVLGRVSWSDTFLASRGGGSRRHHGQDIMGEKMTPLIATFDGIVRVRSTRGHNVATIEGDNGWSAVYMHVNNDTPGTDDGKGGLHNAFAPGIVDGARVRAGQLVGWMGDSGNAEGTAPHLHFELHTPEGYVVNAAPTLEQAEQVTSARLVQLAVDLAIRSDECRVDGVVTKFDPVRKVATIRVSAASRDGKSSACLVPSTRWISLAGATDHGDADVKPGVCIAVVGVDKGVGKAINARVARTAPQFP